MGFVAESYQPVSCDTLSLSDAPHVTIPTSSSVSNQSALITCDENYSTDSTNRHANSYCVVCESSGYMQAPSRALLLVRAARSLATRARGRCRATDPGVSGDKAFRQLEGVRESKVHHSTKHCLRCNRRLFGLSGVFRWRVAVLGQPGQHSGLFTSR